MYTGRPRGLLDLPTEEQADALGVVVALARHPALREIVGAPLTRGDVPYLGRELARWTWGGEAPSPPQLLSGDGGPREETPWQKLRAAGRLARGEPP